MGFKKWIIPGALAGFGAVLVARTLAFQPPEESLCVIEDIPVNQERMAAHLAAMIRCKTISSSDERLVDEIQFKQFRALLRGLYPHVHRTCTVEEIGPSGMLYTLKGKSSDAPVVLMSHYDVVPADEAAWEKPPFAGVIEDGCVWGRGALDTKGTLCGILEAAENLIAAGFVPENDLYFAFSGDEESVGETAPCLVAELERRGVRPAMVLDEGGAVVTGMFPGVARPVAMIGTAEKGILNVELAVKSSGGHASNPPSRTPIGILAKAVVRVEEKPFSAKVTPPVAAMFDTLGRHASFGYRFLFANLWCFKPLLAAICKKRGGELNAMLRTTCAFTMMEGSNASNVLPPEAKMTANLRILTGETIEDAVARLQTVVDDETVEFRPIYGMNPSPNSETSGYEWDALKNAISQTWPDALISPCLMFACTDSRHYCRISDRVYRFSAMALSKEERGLIHSHNERIPVETLGRVAAFYTRLMRRC
ncbi:MAG: M20 family peptidase [Oscillospiraceae bacterium]|nr:M20 family peptidase [Oscillospiraceae bacterium]